MIPTSSRQLSFSLAQWRIFGALFVALVASNRPIANAKVFVAAQTLGVSGAVSEFDDLGNAVGTFAETPGGKILSSLASDGTRIIVGRAEDGFRIYSMEAAFLGYLPGLPTTNLFPYVEFDAHRNIYLLGAGAPRRLNPDGTPSLTLPASGNGIDADAAGNIYVLADSGIQKYSSSGVFVGATSLNQPPGGTSDMVIDEVGKMLYAGYGVNTSGPKSSILAFDISGPTPTFVRSIPGPPTLLGLSFDPISSHLFAANLFGANVWEMTTDGAVVRQYSLPGMNPADVISIRVPEGSTSWMLIVGMACSPLRSLLGRRN